MLAAATSASSKLVHESRDQDASFAPWAALSKKQSKFHDLLKQLAEEHDREIQDLTERQRKKPDVSRPPQPPQPKQRFPSILSHASYQSDADGSGSEVKEDKTDPPEKGSDLSADEASTAPSGLVDSAEPSGSRPRLKLRFDSELEEEGADHQSTANRLGKHTRHESQSLRAIWLAPPGDDAKLKYQQRPGMSTHHAAHGTLEGARRDLRSVENAPSKPCYISYPNSKGRLFWDIFGMVFIAVDFIMIPFSAFDPPETLGMQICAWIILLFWSADIVATFLVGYVERGQIIVEPRRICNNYVRSWLFVDLLVVIPDWLSTLVLSRDSSKPGGTTRLIRILRIARILRLLRLMKIGRILATLEDRIDSEYVFVVMEIFKLVVLVLMTSHILACAFYAIGTVHDGEDTWYMDFKGRSLDYRYFTSLHWSLAKVALESMDVEAKNTRERVFTVSILTLGLFVFSSVVSRITMSMLQMQELGREQSKQFWLLRRYLGERSVPSALGARIQRFVEHEVERQQFFIPEGNVRLLGLLSKHLSGELQSSIAMTILGVHLYIKKLSEMSEVTVFRICEKAITRSQCARGDPLFFRGEDALIMYFVVTGVVRYSQCSNEFELYMPESDCFRIDKKRYLCEPALWCRWVYKGFAALETQSELLELDATAFGVVIQSQPAMHVKSQEYAAQFAQALKQVPLQDCNDMIDCKSLGLYQYLTAEFDEEGGNRNRFGTARRTLMKRTMTQKLSTNSWSRRTRVDNANTSARVGLEEGTSIVASPQEHIPILPAVSDKPPPTNLDMHADLQIIDQIDSIDISQPNCVRTADLEEVEVVNISPRHGFEADERTAGQDHTPAVSVSAREAKRESNVVRPFQSDDIVCDNLES